jgi:hypothetical protein
MEPLFFRRAAANGVLDWIAYKFLGHKKATWVLGTSNGFNTPYAISPRFGDD